MRKETSELKKAFASARQSSNIDYILPVFLESTLYVAGKKIPNQDSPVFFMQRSPTPDRLCITVSEDEKTLSKIENIDVIKSDGRALISELGEAYEIVVVYSEGGDYLSREQLSYFREVLSSLEKPENP